MNQKAKKDARMAFISRVRTPYPRGCIKLSNESLTHFTVKCQVAHWFYKNGWEVYSEADFKGTYSGRADLVVYHSNGDCYAVEILSSETEKRFSEKKYPIPIIRVDTKTFDYTKFCI
jgi:hypothetical protein